MTKNIFNEIDYEYKNDRKQKIVAYKSDFEKFPAGKTSSFLLSKFLQKLDFTKEARLGDLANHLKKILNEEWFKNVLIEKIFNGCLHIGVYNSKIFCELKRYYHKKLLDSFQEEFPKAGIKTINFHVITKKNSDEKRAHDSSMDKPENMDFFYTLLKNYPTQSHLVRQEDLMIKDGYGTKAFFYEEPEKFKQKLLQMFKLKPQWCTRLANGVIAKSRTKTDGSVEIYTIEE